MTRPKPLAFAPENDGHHLLRFRSLFHHGRGYAFPCDALGRVDVESLGAEARDRYFAAKAAVGRELAPPVVEHAP